MKIRLSIIIIAILGLISILLMTIDFNRHIDSNKSKKKIIITTNIILESITKDLVGDNFIVKSVVPNGSDPHTWEPSAKDIELLTKADLIIENGLHLENSISKVLDHARQSGIPFFTATDYTQIRHIGREEIVDSCDSDHQIIGAKDPHIWTDPIAVRDVIIALGDNIKNNFKIDLYDRVASLSDRLTKLDNDIKEMINTIPEHKRNIITGHDSLGYFAKRYGLRVIGAIIPNITTEVESSAENLKNLKQIIAKYHVPVIFTEVGTPKKTADRLAIEAKVKTVMLSTHNMSNDISYFTFEYNLAKNIIQELAS